MQRIKVAVIGAAGYAGIELVRFVLNHPVFELVAASSDGDAGKALAEVYPALVGQTDAVFSTHDEAAAADAVELAFLAVPHTAALAMAPGLMAQGISVLDLSADFRLKDPASYERWYGVPHTQTGILAAAVYGLPELNRAGLKQLAARRADTAVLVACPGCYPTASALAVLPALAAGLAADAPVVINALSGISGAGKGATATTHFCNANANPNAYGVTTHRHTPEIEQTLSQAAGAPVKIVFTPHLVPLTRGLLATATLQLKPGVSAAALEAVYLDAYANEPFVQLLPRGIMPRTASVAGSNNAQLGIALDTHTQTLVASCAIDNLGKGAASQAIQCANILCGLAEKTGLTALAPVV
ncbi:MAG: N-acetyl-gamma-glutamyl-phosphate reductase [Coriobacteriales bacterium]|jgi:N-acetyl-gamma-glutamyl-phosphate reductase|nr:N-acetyl-gamma-glutamyl-phosphate reductase [Coriobacteriales bacterium]